MVLLYILKYYDIAFLPVGGSLEYGWEAFGFKHGLKLVLESLDGSGLADHKALTAESADHCLCPSSLWLEKVWFPS